MASDSFEPDQEGEEQAAAPGAGPAELRAKLQRLADRIGDADRRHNDALNTLQQRLANLGGQGELAEPPGVWDEQTAEALTRHFESGEGDARRWPDGAPPQQRFAATPPQQQEESASASDIAAGRAWLDARLATIAETLQQSIAGVDPQKSLEDLTQRLDELDRRLFSALDDVARRSDVDGLRLVEAQIAELSGQIERANGQLSRLESIDGQIGELGRRLDQRPEPVDSGAAPFGDNDIQALIDRAAEQVATRVAAALPEAPQPVGQAEQRLDAVEGLLKEYADERRRSEEQTAVILGTIEEALGRMADRFDALDAAKLAPPAANIEQDERRALAEAYAQGARALTPNVAAATLNAADYAAAPDDDASAPAEEPVREAPAVAAPAPAGEARSARPEPPNPFHAAAMRAKLKAEGVTTIYREEDKPSRARSKKKAAAAGAGSRAPLLIAGGALLLAGAGFLLVDMLMDRPRAPGAPVVAVPPQKKPIAVPVAPPPPAEAKPQQPAPPQPQAPAVKESEARERLEPLLPARPPRHKHVPETVTDDLSSNAQDGNADRAGKLARAFSATPIAAPVTVEPDDEAEVAPRALPPSIGPASLRQAALAGQPEAEMAIAERFAEGSAVPRDVAEAARWYRRAAMRGFAPAQYRLAGLLERGLGVPADPARAKLWYGRAAAQGHVKAMHNLGVLSASDKLNPDYVEAARWFGAAAMAGLTDSQFNLALLYQRGLGVKKDAKAAYKWFALAARSGDAEAARRMSEAKAGLPPATVEAVDGEIRAWQAKLSHAPAAKGTM